MAVGMTAVLTAGGCWWDQPGAGPGQTFHNAGERVLTAANVATLEQVWTGRGGVSAIVDGKVLGATSSYPETQADVVAHDLASGEEVWSYDLTPDAATGSATHPPVAVGDEVWAGSEALLPSGACANALVRLDLDTGALVAQDTSFAPTELVPFADGVAVQATVYGSGPPLEGCWQTSPGTGRVVESTTAATRWSTWTGGMTGAAAIGGTLYVAPAAGELAAYATAGCGAAQCWPLLRTAPTGTGALNDLAGEATGPLVATAPIELGNRLVAIDPASGSLAGDVMVPMNPTALALADGIAYVAGGTQVVAYDVASCADGTCATVWSASLGGQVTWSDGVAVAGGVVYVGREDGVVEAFATACSSTPCQRKLAEVTVPGTVISLAVANGHMVVGSWTGSAAVVTAFASAG